MLAGCAFCTINSCMFDLPCDNDQLVNLLFFAVVSAIVAENLKCKSIHSAFFCSAGLVECVNICSISFYNGQKCQLDVIRGW